MKKTYGLRIVIVNGRPGSGKTTFEDKCNKILGMAYCERRSTVDKVKEIARKAGWDGRKDEKSRKMLSDLKDIFTEYNDMPFKDVCESLQEWEYEIQYYNVGDHPHVFFIDDREPEHIERMKNELGAITVLIRRPGDEDIITSNHADEKVFQYEYDYEIQNDGSLDDLEMQARVFLNSIFS